MQPLVIIAGPTAVGKTELAIELCERLQAEIISADSMQVYKYMDIGTAKPSIEQQHRVKHHLIDLVEPDQNFSVADYQRHFYQCLNELSSRKKLPVMVGGTGLYIRASLQAFPFTDPGANPEIRRNLMEQAETAQDPQFLHQRLQEVDPQAAARIHPHDSRRLIRALEVYYQTGTPISALQKAEAAGLKYRMIYLFLDREREELYSRIDQRVEEMIATGLIFEVEALLSKGYSPDLKSMQSLGYKQITDYLQGNLTLEAAVTLTKQLTRNYAKRQLTWFRKEPVQLRVNLSEQGRDFFSEILEFVEGRLNINVE
ncbi:MAG: tRNA (adenosine(37)-N6)-dimethylallyltransferase MiaA [Bacillota bacterium]